jgi:uncharacterized protein (DUF2147 family)
LNLMRAGLALAFLMLSAALAMAQNVSPEGVWQAGDNGESKIQIGPCGDALCGRIVWMAAPDDDAGQPKLDANNPEPSLRSQPLLGLTILSDLRPSASKRNQWEGMIYNPEDGKTYAVFVRPKPGALDVEGCLLNFLCQTKTWPKAQP